MLVRKRRDSRKKSNVASRARRAAKRVSAAELERLSKKLMHLRDRGLCQRCGSPGVKSTVQWAHVKAGRSKSLTYAPWAVVSLCVGCHFWFDGNGNGKLGSASRAWWASMFPERDLLLQVWERERRRPEFDPVATKLYLLQEIQRYEPQFGAMEASKS